MFKPYSQQQVEKTVRNLREVLLANLVMLSEIPAATFFEQERGRMLMNRFLQAGLAECGNDDLDNVVGLIAGKNSDSNILLLAHLDSESNSSVDHTATISPESVIGADIGDNALGLAALATLPLIFEELNYQPNSNIILLGCSRSLGRGDLEGVRFFLENSKFAVHTAICLEGLMLGRLSHQSLGMLRGELLYETPDEYDWSRLDAAGAIYHMNNLINEILAIPLPSAPRSSIALTSMDAGSGFNIAHTACLRFEIRSESEKIVRHVGATISDLAEEAASKTQALVKFNQRALRTPGGLAFNHPLTKTVRNIMENLQLQPRVTPSTSDLTAFIQRKIPALTIGLTEGNHLENSQDLLYIEPMITGMLQMLALLFRLDQGDVF